ncbi:MAG: CHRD domain-containing protein [Bryobacteraceae bacterium]
MTGHLIAASCFAPMTVAAPAAVLTFGSNLAPEAAGAKGSGSVSVDYDNVAHTLTIDVSWTRLSGATTVSHIHCCVAPPGTVGVAATPGTLPLFPNGVTSGAYMVTLDLTDGASYTAGYLAGGTAADGEAKLLQGLLDGQAYLNIHTSTFGAGEIRGFLSAAPEPGTVDLVGLALARHRAPPPSLTGLGRRTRDSRLPW